MKLLVVVFALFGFLIIFTKFLKRDTYYELDLLHRIFAPLAEIISGKFERFDSNKTKYKALGINEKTYKIKSICVGLEISFVFLLISLLTISKTNEIQNLSIDKQKFGNSYNKTLHYKVEESEGSLKIKVPRQKILIEDIDAKRKGIRNYIKKSLLGKNKNENEIIFNLNLINHIDFISANVRWEFSEEYITKKGEIIRPLDEDKEVILKAIIVGEDGYEISEEFKLLILKSTAIDANQIKALIKDEDGSVILPRKINNKKIRWMTTKGENGIKKIIVTIILGVIASFCILKKIDMEIYKREQELKNGYSFLLAMLVLFMETGLSASQAWLEICSEYDGETELKKELIKSKVMIEKGRSFDQALNEFAESCNIKEYRKLVRLIIQNLKKGSDALLYILRLELEIIEKDRLNFIKIIAKKAEIKLMLPLMLMLIVIFIVILGPSLISFAM